MDQKITLSNLMDAKRAGRKIASVSCYDYTTARLVAGAGVEMILVGDSAAVLAAVSAAAQVVPVARAAAGGVTVKKPTSQQTG